MIFGRTNTCEVGLSLTCEPQLYGRRAIPWDLSRISGGSSGGAAASVGPACCPMAHATDGFGSIRAPAACCGLVGLKPTRARNTMAPTPGRARRSLRRACRHALGRDSAALLDATRGAGAGDPYAAPSVSPVAAGGRHDTRRATHRVHDRRAQRSASRGRELAALTETVALCTDLGHHVERADPDIEGSAVVPTFLTIAAANTVVNLASHPTRWPPPAPRRGRASDVGHSRWVTA